MLLLAALSLLLLFHLHLQDRLLLHLFPRLFSSFLLLFLLRLHFDVHVLLLLSLVFGLLGQDEGMV